MTAPHPIHHIAILVPNLEEGIARWSNATGFEFSPIGRYRTSRYCDFSDRLPHFHDARITMSRQGSPHIELLEVTGSGTHGPAEVGIHHLGIMDDLSGKQRILKLESLGLTDEAHVLDDTDNILLTFTDKKLLDGIRLEFVSPLPGPVVADDGSQLWRDPATGRASLWGPPDAPGSGA